MAKQSDERQFPCGKTRREAIWEMGGGATGLALLSMLSADGFFAKHGYADSGKTNTPKSPLAPRPSHFPSPVKSVILLTMNGGPSHIDTFDYKPSLTKYAGQELPASFQYTNSGGRKKGFLMPGVRPFRPGGKSGLMISDFYPRLREHADKIALIRSCHTDSHAHGSALVALNTGSTFIGRPALGSWAVYGLGTLNQNLPGYVVILDKRGGPISGQPNWAAGFMPATYQGTLFRPTGDPVLDLHGAVNAKNQRAELDLLEKINHEHLQNHAGAEELLSRIHTYELAYRMQAEVPEAVDLGKEDSKTLDLYGVGGALTGEFGRNCLIARRLVERGVRFVQLYSGGGHLEETWDAHESVEKNHGRHAGETDQPIAALLTDLERRGLLKSTLVIWGGEFGRMPFSEGAGAPGRNHNPYGFTTWMAGAGIKGGTSYGETDEFGFFATVDKAHMHDIHATILHLMGFDHKMLSYFYQGRDERLTDVYGNVIKQVLA